MEGLWAGLGVVKDVDCRVDVAQGVQSPHFSGCVKTAELTDRPPLWLFKKETQEPPVNLWTSESNSHLLSTCESGATSGQHKLVL